MSRKRVKRAYVVYWNKKSQNQNIKKDQPSLYIDTEAETIPAGYRIILLKQNRMTQVYLQRS